MILIQLAASETKRFQYHFLKSTSWRTTRKKERQIDVWKILVAHDCTQLQAQHTTWQNVSGLRVNSTTFLPHTTCHMAKCGQNCVHLHNSSIALKVKLKKKKKKKEKEK